MDSFQTDITPWQNNAKAALTLSFDGGYTTAYDLAMEVLLRYKMRATWFIVTGCIGGSLQGRMVINWEKLKKISSSMEIASHTVTHPRLMLTFRQQIFRYIRSIIRNPNKVFAPNVLAKTRRAVSNAYKQARGVDYTEVLAEAMEAKTMIERHLSQRVDSFAYPGGRYNSSLKKGIKEVGYLSARSTDDGYNFLDSLNFYTLKSKIWNINVDADIANRWVDFAVEKGAWIIETYHMISRDRTTDYYYDTKVSDFDAHLAYVSSKDIWVDTQENIVKYLKERNATKVKVDIISAKKIVLLVENDLDPKIYNQALTLKNAVPTTWLNVRITQDGDVQQVSPTRKSKGHYIHYNVLPNKGKIILTPSG